MEVNLEVAKSLGLLEEEYNKIIETLGRTPTFTELSIYSVMWSEHCSYKNSIAELKKLPRSGGKLLVSAGEENAGLIDIGDGLAVAFKIESHNHPSAVEPFQGAATGVGGILRDIFTMGARPIAALNSLRFGNIIKKSETDSEDNIERSKFLFEKVVEGIGHYGNCFGVPTVSGEVYFEECYQDNPLVNAMAVGIVKHNETATAKASGAGNPVFIVGSSTGKDGIHGATFASEEISEESESKRPNVQVGDPFTEKLLLEATLEIIKSGIVVGIQDMGAAGITCSTSEMSAKGNCGMKINLNKVPLRDKNMSAFEIMLSESQERMLVVIKKGEEQKAIDIFKKWDLNCVQIGEVIDEPNVKIYFDEILVADIPAQSLVLGGDAPVYIREKKSPSYLNEKQNFDFNTLKHPNDLNQITLKLLSSPNITNKNWVYRQYDTQVRTNTVLLPGCDSSVIRIKGTEKALSMKVDCNSKYVYLNPYKGGMIAVSECARNVICSGGEPLGITNCLNFGNPYNPEVYFQFSEALRGMGDACKKFNTPVTGGNVSFYNQSKDYAVFPTPTIGVIGLIENVKNVTTSYFKNEGDVILLLGVQNSSELGGSEYLNHIHNLVTGDAPDLNLEYEFNLQSALLSIIKNNLINSAHDISDGGLSVALSECIVMNQNNPVGCEVNIDLKFGKHSEYFGETQSRVIISCDKNNLPKIKSIADKYSVEIKNIGTVTGKKLKINNDIELNINDIYNTYYQSLENIMNN
ncbi:MAG TPA: phosphoribosylformylglycinamidine synthase subunit PurL [Bacteroidetes bacterium]|nr:phosphoribosylformylglycinamidine synthase subunit PurL [Bacteroidota bacterium]HCN38383.1 phosphoribosylformylglycinamidine synthase subunit PurL [Bacteroidota bacterium]